MAAGSGVVVDSAAAWPEDAVDVKEGAVANWFVHEGAHVAADEVLCEIQVEKVRIDVLAPTTGTVAAVLVAEGEEFARGDALAELDPH
jgi:pyruvate/2-oxoglutarate dehydrogenase complex dihydrolipoamide acyltransferase (E2) component